jgi:hypothetical protein
MPYTLNPKFNFNIVYRSLPTQTWAQIEVELDESQLAVSEPICSNTSIRAIMYLQVMNAHSVYRTSCLVYVCFDRHPWSTD